MIVVVPEMSTAVEKAVSIFLGDPSAVCMGVCGEVGSGKMFTVESVASKLGWSPQIIDRSQRVIDWAKFSYHTLGGSGLTKSLYIVCNARESNWDFLAALKGKFVFISNDELHLAGLKRNKFKAGDVTANNH